MSLLLHAVTMWREKSPEVIEYPFTSPLWEKRETHFSFFIDRTSFLEVIAKISPLYCLQLPKMYPKQQEFTPVFECNA